MKVRLSSLLALALVAAMAVEIRAWSASLASDEMATRFVLVQVTCEGSAPRLEHRPGQRPIVDSTCHEQVIANIISPGSVIATSERLGVPQAQSAFPEKPGWPRTFSRFGGAPLTLANLGDSRGLSTVFRDADGVMHALAPDGYPIDGWPVLIGEIAGGGPLAAADLIDDGHDEFILPRGVLLTLSSSGGALPGWPYDGGGFLGHIGLAARFDNDGPLRVVSAGAMNPPSSHLAGGFVLDHSGGLLPGWPALIPKGFFASPIVAGPAVGDVTGDGNAEVVVAVRNESELWVFDRNGTVIPGFPVGFGPMPFSGPEMDDPSLGDLEGDGNQEIILRVITPDVKPAVIVFEGDGTVRPGWPQLTNAGDSFGGSSLGDVDDDGRLEIVATTLGGGINIEGGVYVWNDDGTLLPGWPKLIEFTGFGNSATIADVDGDGQGDIIATGATAILPLDGVIYAWKSNGDLIPGFPIILPLRPLFSAAIATVADIDLDGTAELGVVSQPGAFSFTPSTVHWFDLGVPYRPEGMQWPTWAHDMARTGSYTPPVRFERMELAIHPGSLSAATPAPPLTVRLKLPEGQTVAPESLTLERIDGVPVAAIAGQRLVPSAHAAADRGAVVFRFDGEMVRAALPGLGSHLLEFASEIIGGLGGVKFSGEAEITLRGASAGP